MCDFLGLSRTALFDVLDLYADSKLLLAPLTSYFSLSFFFFFFEFVVWGFDKDVQRILLNVSDNEGTKKKKRKHPRKR